MTEPNPSPRRRKPRVAVVFGGRSTEHAVSCVSAGSVLRAIGRDDYDVVPVGISRDGRWVLAADEPDRLAITGDKLPEVDGAGASVVLAGDPSHRGLTVYEPGAVPQELGEVDVVLPLLHGPYGEDGTLQGLLELAGVPYVGSGVFASAAAMDKGHAKTLLRSAGLDTPGYVIARRGQDVTAAMKELDFPVFVKPARGGSSIGITKVDSADALPAALDEAHRHDPKALIEQAVAGREVECGVLAGPDGRPEASIPAEVRVTGGQSFYDFEAKYLSDATEFDIPPPGDAPVVARIRESAVRAFEALDCEGLARVDFFVTDDGRVLINEVNTMPGFTPASMFPRMWAAAGVDYPTLISRLLDDALRRGTGLR